MGQQLSNQAVDWREGRRLRAWELHEAGWTQASIAQALGVTPGAVSQWMRRAREGGGVGALRCVFRINVTAEFGNVTGHFGDVTGRRLTWVRAGADPLAAVSRGG